MPTPKRRPGHQAASPAADAFPVVGIGASAGGLEACRNFIRALPPKTGMAFVLIQHLDPTHESVMGDLLASLATWKPPVRQATWVRPLLALVGTASHPPV